MAEYRMIKTKIWRDKKFRKWDSPTRLLCFYLMTNEYVPPSGLYEIDLDIVRISIGFNGKTFEESFNRLATDDWLMYDANHNLVWIVNYLKHYMYKNQSVMVNVYQSVAEAPQVEIVSKFKEKYSNLLGEWEQAVRTLGIEKNSIEKKRKGKSLTPSPTQDIFDHWDKCYVKATGEKYPFFGERDGRMFKSLAVKYNKEKVNSLISEFFKQADEDPNCWWHDKLDVVIWYRQIPKLITQLTRGK